MRLSGKLDTETQINKQICNIFQKPSFSKDGFLFLHYEERDLIIWDLPRNRSFKS